MGNGIVHILNQEAEGLVDELRHLSPEQRRLILADACSFVSRHLTDPDVALSDILKKISENGELSEDEVTRTKAMAAKADDHYLALKQEGAFEAEWKHWFSKARLLTAIATGFGDDSCSGTADAIYELCCISTDSSELIALIRSIIKNLPH